MAIFKQYVDDTHAIVVRQRSLSVLHSKVFILATPPQGLHFIVVVRVCIWATGEETVF